MKIYIQNSEVLLFLWILFLYTQIKFSIVINHDLSFQIVKGFFNVPCVQNAFSASINGGKKNVSKRQNEIMFDIICWIYSNQNKNYNKCTDLDFYIYYYTL